MACYLKAHEAKAVQGTADEGGEPDYSAMTPEERKRAKVCILCVVDFLIEKMAIG